MHPIINIASGFAATGLLVVLLGSAGGCDDAGDDSNADCAEASNAPGTARVPLIRLVFSSFGELFTVLFGEDLDPAKVDDVIATVADAGFTFVAYNELEEPYTGINAHLSDLTWFTRFFCYL